MNFFLIIVNSKGKKFSQLKKSSPKMKAVMDELCEKYKTLFGEEFKVKRAILTPKGIKIV